MKTLANILRDLALLGLVGLGVWLFPKTTLAIEGLCGIGTLGLFLVERAMA
ncbi:MAG TPA: hypothetical protein VJX29_03560 [Candidatus Acidoferrales bacterium]|nr:hypothetical protein [Candidatus Acidoferrales bacterium]